MAKWLNSVSNFLDDLDSSAKTHIAKNEGDKESATQRRLRKRREQLQAQAAGAGDTAGGNGDAAMAEAKELGGRQGADGLEVSLADESSGTPGFSGEADPHEDAAHEDLQGDNVREDAGFATAAAPDDDPQARSPSPAPPDAVPGSGTVEGRIELADAISVDAEHAEGANGSPQPHGSTAEAHPTADADTDTGVPALPPQATAPAAPAAPPRNPHASPARQPSHAPPSTLPAHAPPSGAPAEPRLPSSPIAMSWIAKQRLGPNSSPAVLLRALKEAEQALAEQGAELEDVCLELEKEEERARDLDEDLKAAGEALAHATRRAAARESELRDTISELKRSRTDADKAARSSITQTQRDAEEAKTTLARQEAEIATLTERARKLEEDKKTAEDTVDELRSVGSQSVQGAKAEVRVLEARLEEIETQHASATRTLRRREADLERTNTELTRTLADKERALAALRSQGPGASGDGDDMDSLLREEAIAATTALRAERSKTADLQAELERVHQEQFQQAAQLEEQRGTSAAELRREAAQRTSLEGEVRARDEKIKALEAQVRSGARGLGRVSSGSTPSVVEERIKAMTEQLMKKQLALDEANCEKAALKARLSASGARLSKLESQVQRHLTSQGTFGDDGDADVEDGSRRLRRRNNMSALIKPVTKSEGVSKAVDAMDRFMMHSARVLRANAGARAVFLLYLFLLHFWTFTLLAFHTHVTLDP